MKRSKAYTQNSAIGSRNKPAGQPDSNQTPSGRKSEHRATDPVFKGRDLWPAGALLLVGILGLGCAMLRPTGNGGQYAVVAPLWYSQGETVALIRAADGRIADMSGPANVAIVQSENPDFVHALYGAGAWLVVDPLQLRGCVNIQPPVGTANP